MLTPLKKSSIFKGLSPYIRDFIDRVASINMNRVSYKFVFENIHWTIYHRTARGFFSQFTMRSLVEWEVKYTIKC